jgi:ribose-phosphate pyrophosphokinase
MSAIQIFAFADERAPASRLAAALNAPLVMIETHRFPDGETLPHIPPPAAEISALYCSLDHPNPKLVELLLAADALRRAGCRRLILVAPYLCYMRQDAVFSPGEPLSRDVIASLIGRAFDAVVTVQAHLHRTGDLEALLGVPAMNLIPIEPLAAALPAYDTPPIVLGPDLESRGWVEAWVERLHGQPVVLRKTRYGDRDVRETAEANPVEATGRAVVIVDDIASSGVTLTKAVQRLRRAGAASIDIAVAHAMTTPGVTDALMKAGVRRFVSTDSVRHSTNAAPLAPLLAQAVRTIGQFL